MVRSEMKRCKLESKILKTHIIRKNYINNDVQILSKYTIYVLCTISKVFK